MIPSDYFWMNIFLLAVGTLAIRGSIIAISSRIKISERLRELFSYIPAAILPAFVAPAVFFHKGSVGWLAGRERLVIMILATAICHFTRSTLATLGFGLGSLYLLTTLTF
jgi:branched-subunit amino acid transport protein